LGRTSIRAGRCLFLPLSSSPTFLSKKFGKVFGRKPYLCLARKLAVRGGSRTKIELRNYFWNALSSGRESRLTHRLERQPTSAARPDARAFLFLFGMAGQIHRQKKTTGFVVMSVECLQDIRLKWDAKGLHSYLMQLPDDWQVNMADLQNRSASGREATASPMNALIEAGYVTRRRVVGANGKFEGYDYDVFETAQSAVNGKTVNGKTVNGKTVNGKTATNKNELQEELRERTHSVVSVETTAFSFPLESEMPTTASDAAWAVELFEPPVTEIIAPPAESASDTQPGDPLITRNEYAWDFEAFWKSYNYCAGSKLTASKRWGRLSAKEKALASDALPAHLRATTTDKARRKDSPFQPMRCHAAVYLAEKRWEAYAEVVKVAKGEELAPTKWDKKYKAYLRCCETRWPNMLASVAYLSKPDYCAFQDGAYLHGISRVGTEMQKKRFERMHDKWESGDPSLRGHSNIWPCFLAEMSAFIKQSSSL